MRQFMKFQRKPIIITLHLQLAEAQYDDIEHEKQIPVISDIERIKKIVDILEFVGAKVGDLIDNLPQQSETIQKRVVRDDDDVPQRQETTTTEADEIEKS